MKIIENWEKENSRIESSQCTDYNQNSLGIIIELQERWRYIRNRERRSEKEHITQILQST